MAAAIGVLAAMAGFTPGDFHSGGI